VTTRMDELTRPLTGCFEGTLLFDGELAADAKAPVPFEARRRDLRAEREAGCGIVLIVEHR